MLPNILNRSVALLISLAISAASLAGQQKAAQQKPEHAAPAKAAAVKKTQADQPAATIDTLLAADSYKVYGEVKNVGNLIRSGNIADLIDPIVKLAGPPKEFKLLIKFANAHAESLTTARLVFAAWPARPQLPQGLFAIEFSTPEEARKFEPQLREFLPKILPAPTPTPAAEKTAEPQPAGEKKSETVVTPQSAAKPAPLPFQIKQTGSLVLISDRAFTLKSLRPGESKLLADDQNFRQARDRFASEPIFVFVNIALDEKSRAAVVPQDQGATETSKTQTQSWEPIPEPSDEPSEMRKVAQAPNTQAPETTPVQDQPTATTAFVVQEQTNGVVLTGQDRSAVSRVEQSDPIGPALNQLMFALVGGETKWPEAVGAAIAFDGDAYVLRVLLLNGADGRASAVPFIPQLVTGPALTLESPAILPADTEFFVTASLDPPQIYEGLVKAMNDATFRSPPLYRQTSSNSQPAVPFADLEKQLGIKIKEDLLPVLGNEVAVSIPLSTITGKPPAKQPEAARSPETRDEKAAKTGEPSPVILISLKDKEGARALLPRIIDGLIGSSGGSKPLSEIAKSLAQTEKREDTETISYAGLFSYAFIGNFLVVSTDAAATRHVVDSYLSHQTLSADNHFRNFTRWQPRQVQGQVYVSPALMESYRASANEPSFNVNDAAREFIMRLGPEAEPLTYALWDDGLGPMHELHVPKGLLLMAVAGLAGEANPSPQRSNEGMATAALSMIASSEAQYNAGKGKGNYATLDQLIAEGSLPKDLLQNHGYRIELTVSGTRFEASAVPLEYGSTGHLSYFVDESSIIRAADHAGAPATVADKPLQ